MSSPFCTARGSLRYKRRARLPASSSSAAKGPSLDLPDYYDYKPPWTSLKRSLSRAGNSNNNKRRSANAANANAKLSANAAAAAVAADKPTYTAVNVDDDAHVPSSVGSATAPSSPPLLPSVWRDVLRNAVSMLSCALTCLCCGWCVPLYVVAPAPSTLRPRSAQFLNRMCSFMLQGTVSLPACCLCCIPPPVVPCSPPA